LIGLFSTLDNVSALWPQTNSRKLDSNLFDGFAASTAAASGPKKLLSGPAAAVYINTLAYVD